MTTPEQDEIKNLSPMDTLRILLLDTFFKNISVLHNVVCDQRTRDVTTLKKVYINRCVHIGANDDPDSKPMVICK